MPTPFGDSGIGDVTSVLDSLPVTATIVSLPVFTGGVGLVRTALTGVAEAFADSWWATIGPTLLFPLWAVALGWGTFAYRERRLAAESQE